VGTARDELRIQVLGPVQATLGESALELGPPKQRAILALLALRAGQHVLLDEVVEALWAGRTPDRAVNLVHTYVARLRQVLEPSAPRRRRVNVIASVPGGYRLAVPNDDLDLHVFRQQMQHAAKLGDQPKRAFTLLEDALRQWRDPQLEDLHTLLPHQDDLGPLRQEFVGTALDYITLGLGQNRGDTVLPVAERLATAEPLNERVQARLLRVLVSTGQRAWAIERYLELQARLRDELGVDPGPELTGAYRQALAAEAGSAAGGAAPAVTPSWRGPGPGVDTLVGRQADLTSVHSLLSRYRLVTLTGAVGVGKTALALSVADAARDCFTDGVVVADLAEAQTYEDVVRIISGAVDEIAPGDTDGRAGSLVSRLGDHHVLLLLDNAELVTDQTADLVDDILRACGRVHVLLTSRELLGMAYEAVYPVRPLEMNPEASALRTSPALELFARRAAQVRPDFRLTEANFRTVATVCRGLDGLPLAIELAAASLRTSCLDTLVEGLRDPLHEIRPTRRGEPTHHRTLHAAVRRSFDLLDAAEQRCFAALGAMPGEFCLEAATAAGARLSTGPWNMRLMLDRLVDKSLLEILYSEGARRYRMFGTVHALAREMLHNFPGGAPESAPGTCSCGCLAEASSSSPPPCP
jgi:predicted ATPase/DNA-binding SARP family transcriptional activator